MAQSPRIAAPCECPGLIFENCRAPASSPDAGPSPISAVSQTPLCASLW